MKGLPLDLVDEILLRLDPRSVAMMRCTDKSFRSYISDPRFGPECPSWARPYLFNLYSYGAVHVYFQPLVSSTSSCDSVSDGKKISSQHLCYILGSCSGLLLLYFNGLFVVNPLTKRFRLLDCTGSSKLRPIIADRNDTYLEENIARTERWMCVGFTVNRNRTTKRFKIVCILEIMQRRVYRFEISDGDSWRLSKRSIAVSSESDLTKRMKPVYLDDTLHWLRNDGSIIAFNAETEQARFIPSVFHTEPEMKLLFAPDDKTNLPTLVSGTKEAISVYTLGLGSHKWALTRQIKNISMEESELEYWDVVAYDGKRLVVWEKKGGCLHGVLHVYDMKANGWGVLGSTRIWSKRDRDFYKFTLSFLSIEEEDERKSLGVLGSIRWLSNSFYNFTRSSFYYIQEDQQKKVAIAPNDKRLPFLNAVMGLIDTTK